MPAIVAYDGRAPRLAASVFLAEGSVVTGDVEIGEDSSLWFGTVVRGDVNRVRIGARTNLQDQVVVHVTSGTHPTVITGKGGGLHPDMKPALLMAFVSFTLLVALLIWQRTRIERLRQRAEALEIEAAERGLLMEEN